MERLQVLEYWLLVSLHFAVSFYVPLLPLLFLKHRLLVVNKDNKDVMFFHVLYFNPLPDEGIDSGGSIEWNPSSNSLVRNDVDRSVHQEGIFLLKQLRKKILKSMKEDVKWSWCGYKKLCIINFFPDMTFEKKEEQFIDNDDEVNTCQGKSRGIKVLILYPMLKKAIHLTWMSSSLFKPYLRMRTPILRPV